MLLSCGIGPHLAAAVQCLPARSLAASLRTQLRPIVAKAGVVATRELPSGAVQMFRSSGLTFHWMASDEHKEASWRLCQSALLTLGFLWMVYDMHRANPGVCHRTLAGLSGMDSISMALSGLHASLVPYCGHSGHHPGDGVSAVSLATRVVFCECALSSMAIFCPCLLMQGTILAFVTEFFADFLATDNIDDLVALLKKARLDDRLMEFFPPQQRSLDQFNTHFKVRGANRSRVNMPCCPFQLVLRKEVLQCQTRAARSVCHQTDACNRQRQTMALQASWRRRRACRR